MSNSGEPNIQRITLSDGRERWQVQVKLPSHVARRAGRGALLRRCTSLVKAKRQARLLREERDRLIARYAVPEPQEPQWPELSDQELAGLFNQWMRGAAR